MRNSPEKTLLCERIQLNVSKGMYRFLHAIAENEKTTLSDVVRTALFFYFYIIEKLEIDKKEVFPFMTSFEMEILTDKWRKELIEQKEKHS